MDTIGRREYIDFIEWGLASIEAKVDTGAYGCALHCHHIEIVEIKGKKLLSFRLLDPSHPEYDEREYLAKEFRDKRVKSSSGQWEHRYTVVTGIKLGRETYEVEFSLTDRSEMKYPVLLGRKFLKKRFLVDVSIKYRFKKIKITK